MLKQMTIEALQKLLVAETMIKRRDLLIQALLATNRKNQERFVVLYKEIRFQRSKHNQETEKLKRALQIAELKEIYQN